MNEELLTENELRMIEKNLPSPAAIDRLIADCRRMAKAIRDVEAQAQKYQTGAGIPFYECIFCGGISDVEGYGHTADCIVIACQEAK